MGHQSILCRHANIIGILHRQLRWHLHCQGLLERSWHLTHLRRYYVWLLRASIAVHRQDRCGHFSHVPEIPPLPIFKAFTFITFRWGNLGLRIVLVGLLELLLVDGRQGMFWSYRA